MLHEGRIKPLIRPNGCCTRTCLATLRRGGERRADAPRFFECHSREAVVNRCRLETIRAYWSGRVAAYSAVNADELGTIQAKV